MVKFVRNLGNKLSPRTSTPLRAAVILLFSGILAACSAPRELSESDKSQLIQRVTERWRCLEQNDYACAYAFQSPAYRAVFSAEMYRNRYFSALERRLTGVKVVAYDSGAAVASVRVGVMSRSLKEASSASQAIGITPTTLTEAWLWGSGTWWIAEDL
jgi:hypothetical protein